MNELIMSAVELEGLAYIFDDGSWFQVEVEFCFIPVSVAIDLHLKYSHVGNHAKFYALNKKLNVQENVSIK